MADVRDLLSRIQQRVPKCPQLVLRDAYVAAARSWCGQTRWLRQNLTGALVADRQVYDLGSDPFVEIVDVPALQIFVTTGGRTQAFGMKPSDPHSFDPNQPHKQPWTYAYLPEGSIAFYPIPSQAYDVLLELAVQPTRSATEIDDTLLAKHWAAFESGALAHVLQLPEPWRDPQTAAAERALFQASINNGKADVARGFQSGTVMIRKRAFIVGP